jgi:hypothetical protein
MYNTSGVVRGLKGKPFKTGSTWFATSLSYRSRRQYCDAAVSVKVSCEDPVETEDDLVASLHTSSVWNCAEHNTEL